jgi:hypothetical protein
MGAFGVWRSAVQRGWREAFGLYPREVKRDALRTFERDASRAKVIRGFGGLP